MKLSRPIVFFDIESTGLDTVKDRIIEIGLIKIASFDLPAEKLVFLCNPGVPIPPQVTEVHGFSDADVQDQPPLSSVAFQIFDFIHGCDLAGFNLLNFDIPLLWEELHRCGIELYLGDVHIIDVGNIFKKKEERTLSAGVRFYSQNWPALAAEYERVTQLLADILQRFPETQSLIDSAGCGIRTASVLVGGREHIGAHCALSDVEATAEMLIAQRQRYPDLATMDVPQLAAFSKMDDRVDLAGIIVRNKAGEPVFNTKRNKGVRVVDDIGYADWMLYKGDFPTETKQRLSDILEPVR